MRILVCGEGKHDIGVSDFWCDQQEEYISIEGWMQPLIRAIKGAGVTLSIRRRRDLVILPRDARQFQPMPAGHGARALLAKRAAALGNFDAVIYMADADSTDVRRWREIEAQIFEGFSRIESAVVGLACIPMSASESWLLADAAAWQNITGNGALSLPRNPETIWGERDDPDADHPHRYFARICDESNQADGHDVRLRIAQVIDIPTLRNRCAISFEPFYQTLLAA